MICHFTEQKSASGPYLICCPASVLPNWSAELQRWAPKLRVVEYKGSMEAREETYYKKVSQCGVHNSSHASDMPFIMIPLCQRLSVACKGHTGLGTLNQYLQAC